MEIIFGSYSVAADGKPAFPHRQKPRIRNQGHRCRAPHKCTAGILKERQGYHIAMIHSLFASIMVFFHPIGYGIIITLFLRLRDLYIRCRAKVLSNFLRYCQSPCLRPTVVHPQACLSPRHSRVSGSSFPYDL